MQKDAYRAIQELLASEMEEEIRQGLDLVRSEISRIGSGEAKQLFEIVTTIFYIDPLDRPDLVPILDEAVSLIVGFGDWVIPILVENLDAGDIKAQFAIANTLGRIGADAIKPLVAKYETSPNPAYRSFILYALGKIKSPKIIQATRLVLEAAQSDDPELRDTAVRAIGKFAESIPPSHLSEEQHREFIEILRTNLAYTDHGIRAKAVRSLGKLAKYGHIPEPEREKLKALYHLILGMDESFEWDRAYIVRKEAKEALKYI